MNGAAADDVSVMAEMLEVLIIALELMNEESSALSLEINWNKTKIQASDIIVGAAPDVTILGHKADGVDSFVYLGSWIDVSGGNDSDIRRRIECMHEIAIDRAIWRSSISLFTKLRLYNVYILPVLLYDGYMTLPGPSVPGPSVPGRQFLDRHSNPNPNPTPNPVQELTVQEVSCN